MLLLGCAVLQDHHILLLHLFQERDLFFTSKFLHLLGVLDLLLLKQNVVDL